ncbi:hypothetical protein RC52_03420 [Herbaspirillum rubrisubalbicans]|nr:hypothetical protein [Herbaspirillum rubrisubalbicans]
MTHSLTPNIFVKDQIFFPAAIQSELGVRVNRTKGLVVALKRAAFHPAWDTDQMNFFSTKINGIAATCDFQR